MEQVTTFRQASSSLFDLKVAETDQTTMADLEIDPFGIVFALGFSIHYRHDGCCGGSGVIVLDWFCHHEFVQAASRTRPAIHGYAPDA